MIKKDIPKQFLSEYPYDGYGYRKFIEGAKWQREQMKANTADAMIGLPYENKDVDEPTL